MKTEPIDAMRERIKELFEKPILNVKGKLGFWNYELPEEYETILKL